MIVHRSWGRWLPPLLAIGGLSLTGVPSLAHTNLFFLHHSTGHNLIDQGQMRPYFTDYNATHGTHFAFWDHDYNGEGLRDPDGTYAGHSYDIPGDNTDPDGLYTLWTVPNAARDSILTNHEVIAFKSCYPASHIYDDATLAQYQSWYLAMRNVFDSHPERIFIVMSPPPLHRLDTNLSEADRARAFADWLGSAAYLSGHPNIVYFDLFDHLARPSDGTGTRNMLRYEYELDHSSGDSHPNLLANQAVGPVFAQFLIEAAGEAAGADEATPQPGSVILSCSPNPIRTRATLRYETDRPGWTRLSVHDLAGRRIEILLDRYDQAGVHEVTWNPSSREGVRAAGVYWARLERDGRVAGGRRLIVVP
jgi:hypothetical protein